MTVNYSARGPGIYHDITAAEYHADPCGEPSLSSGIANLLLAKTPTHAHGDHPKFKRFAGKPPTQAMNIGSVAHEILLGKGAGFEIAPFDDYRVPAARKWRDDVIARGLTPIKADDFHSANQMVDVIRARVAITPGAERAFLEGTAETVILWRDGAVMCRAMIDWLDLNALDVFDLKTTERGLNKHTLQQKIAGGLDVQAAFYIRGLENLIPDGVARFSWHWVFVENEPPFESRIIKMDATTRAIGNRKAARAIKIWGKCLEDNSWPGYPREIEQLEYPAWAEDAWIAREIEESEPAHDPRI